MADTNVDGSGMTEERMQELAKKAQALVDSSHSIRVATIVMLSAWRLFYCSRLVMDNYIEEEEDITEQEQSVITHILATSLYEEALKPYKVEELVAVLVETCVPFLQTQESNISEDLKEGNEDGA